MSDIIHTIDGLDVSASEFNRVKSRLCHGKIEDYSEESHYTAYLYENGTTIERGQSWAAITTSRGQHESVK